MKNKRLIWTLVFLPIWTLGPIGTDLSKKNTKEPNKAKVVSLTERLKPLFKAAAVVAIVLTLGNAAQVPFQNDVDNQIENVGYTKSGKGVSVAMGDSASVDSMQRTGIDQISTTTASPTILK